MDETERFVSAAGVPCAGCRAMVTDGVWSHSEQWCDACAPAAERNVRTMDLPEALTQQDRLKAAIRTLQDLGAWAEGRPCVPGSATPEHPFGNVLLTQPSKMPGFSWSLPAGNPRNGQEDGKCPGAVFGIGAICSSCYANPDSLVKRKSGAMERRGGNYDRPSVRRAQKARSDWTMDCLGTKEGRARWVTVMTAAITWATRTYDAAARMDWDNEYRDAICLPPYATPPEVNPDTRRILYFRWHDSGDVFSPRYGDMIREVCAALPDVRFWLPTRSWHSTPRILAVLQDVNTLPNVAVRPSALYLEQDAPVVPGLSAGTGAKSSGATCPAHLQNNECRQCRVCWGKTRPAYYKVH
jgi:hypothetical protein